MHRSLGAFLILLTTMVAGQLLYQLARRAKAEGGQVTLTPAAAKLIASSGEPRAAAWERVAPAGRARHHIAARGHTSLYRPRRGCWDFRQACGNGEKCIWELKTR